MTSKKWDGVVTVTAWPSFQPLGELVVADLVDHGWRAELVIDTDAEAKALAETIDALDAGLLHPDNKPTFDPIDVTALVPADVWARIDARVAAVLELWQEANADEDEKWSKVPGPSDQVAR